MKIDGVIGRNQCHGRTPLLIYRTACLNFLVHCRQNYLFFGKSSSERKREIASESLQPMSWPGSPSPIMRTALTQQVTTTDRGKSSPNTRQRLDTTSWLVAAKGRIAQVTIVQANKMYYAQFWTQENSTTYKNLRKRSTKRTCE